MSDHYPPTSKQLRGVSLAVAECYGKPHVGCYYANNTIKSHKRNEDALCLCCGKIAQSAHHVPPLGKAHFFVLETPRATYALRPALFAVCGNGTTGCHNDFHGGARFFARWLWHDDEYASAWWSGELLRIYEPHSDELYRYGCWAIEDRKLDRKFTVSA